MTMRPTIAIVDDEEGVHKIFQAHFHKEVKKELLDVQYFFNGQECVDFLQTKSETKKVLLILSDINMPVMDGFSLLSFVKKEFPSIEIYMITAYENEEYMRKINELGADKFLAKPLDFKKLKNEIKEKFSLTI